jgi:outer membrane protein OmpA-like peptidoglycan-associated protein
LPPVKQEIVEKVTFAARRIQFEEGKATLVPASLKVLDDVVTILKQNQEIKLLIEGHTSNNADYDLNMKLSRDRAKTVKDYLIKKGIAPSRLNTVGYGPNRPLNSGKLRLNRL